MVSDTQHAFIKGREILDAMLIAVRLVILGERETFLVSRKDGY